MKPFEQQTYYELLEVPVTAPMDDIRAAYSRLMELYAPDSIAVYALVDPEQVDSLRARMTEAMEILTDADLRVEYDKELGLPVRRMADTVTAAGKPSAEATPTAGTVERAAEALASSASAGAEEGSAAAASVEDARAAGSGKTLASAAEAPASELAQVPASPVSTSVAEVHGAESDEAPASPASTNAADARVVESDNATASPTSTEVGPSDFRATFFRGFSFAYVSSSLQDSQLLGSSVNVPSATSASESPSTQARDTAAASTPPPLPTRPVTPVAAASAAEAAPAAPVAASTPEPVPGPSAAAAASMTASEPGLSSATVAAVTAPVPAAVPPPLPTQPTAPAVAATTTAPVSAPAVAAPTTAPAPASVPPPLPTASSSTLATVPGRAEPALRPGARTPAARIAAHKPSEPGHPAPRPGPGRQLGDAQVLAQDSAIATAEAALAQVAARVREPRPRTPDIPSDAEFNGELLRRVREARQFSLQQVADRTRISKAHLENVEADRYGALPAPVYLRGILMNLARELGLDPLRVSRSYLALASEKSGKK
ncbi:helix-turn-helix domain-containing protein [Pyxidicoccus parkwayensis]|uniref:Helix-turn-helix domain-containing protein n=1 Tax=Pyxidicoccus parkwayensis TaxID=2813578 RepID=A0ABX7P8P8_9BACT|nr:helix-turn-helix domain-containing protein [Pyxidicoccus parkwaysis]QSQ26889.1 helix-turn-helix domain-containing protein [Pyxidicoccus parkwaysis]